MRIKFSMRGFVALAPLLAIGTLPAISSGLPTIASVSAGQGKGGEVVAKPTPTPKKTTSKRTAPARTTNNSKTNQATKSAGEAATTAEMIFWNSIRDSTNPDDFKAYLKKYPNGEFADLARNRLRTLEASQPKTSATPEAPKETTPASPQPAPTTSPKPGASVRNQMGMELVYVPAGGFMMGSKIWDTEYPVHQVTFNYSFYIGKYEVTQEQWQAVMGKNPSFLKDCGSNCPVEQVSWDDAQEFLNKLNNSHDGYYYRLPTEAEWEYACRAGTTGDYSGNLDAMAWYTLNSGNTTHPDGTTHPVGGKQANALGLYDLHGNVWEWCQDIYHENYFGAPADGGAWLSGGLPDYRVLRGGSWMDKADDARSARRSYMQPSSKGLGRGVRVVAIKQTQ